MAEGGNGRPRISIPISREGILVLAAVIGMAITTIAKIGGFIQELRDEVAGEARERKDADDRIERDAGRTLGTINDKLDAVLRQHQLIIDRTLPAPRGPTPTAP